MTKYHVGDRVKIKSLDWYNANKDTRNQVMCHPSCFVPDMARFCGQVMTIRAIVYGSCYRLKEDKINYNWTDGMIEGLVDVTDETLVERAGELFSEPQEKKMKYKPGDRVKLIDESEGIVYRSPFGDITLDKRSLRWLCGWFGKEVTLDSAHNGLYTAIEIKGYYLAEEMIEGLADVPEVNPDAEGWVNEFVCPDGYEFRDENGNVINGQKIFLEKKKSKCPETYEECCRVLGIDVRDLDILDNMLDNMLGTSEIIYRKNRLQNSFRKLLICRDAYWKIAGEEMGLDKPWSPSDSDYITGRYCIFVHRGNIICDTPAQDCVLTFPTEEMRDAFYENFKGLIEECKELL